MLPVKGMLLLLLSLLTVSSARLAHSSKVLAELAALGAVGLTPLAAAASALESGIITRLKRQANANDDDIRTAVREAYFNLEQRLQGKTNCLSSVYCERAFNGEQVDSCPLDKTIEILGDELKKEGQSAFTGSFIADTILFANYIGGLDKQDGKLFRCYHNFPCSSEEEKTQVQDAMDFFYDEFYASFNNIIGECVPT